MDQNQSADQTTNRAPRQIAIGILDDDAPKSSMKILSMPAITTSASKVVDFRQITMKSDFNQVNFFPSLQIVLIFLLLKLVFVFLL